MQLIDISRVDNYYMFQATKMTICRTHYHPVDLYKSYELESDAYEVQLHGSVKTN